MSVLLLNSAAERFGRVVRTREAGDFRLRLASYDAALETPAHCHPLAYFCFVVRGGVDERCAGSGHRFEPGSVHFHPPQERHSVRIAPTGLTSLSIIPEGPLAEWTASAGTRGAWSGGPRRLTPLAGRCYDAFCGHDQASDLTLEAAALELLAGAVREEADTPAKRAPRWIAEVRDYLHAHFPEPIALRTLAGVAGVHEVHVVRAFRRHVGVTPGAYVRRLRIEAARNALIGSSASIAEIALAAGFSSQAHFGRAFHREIGLPPGVFRRRHAPPRS